jgi:hypothetical protein
MKEMKNIKERMSKKGTEDELKGWVIFTVRRFVISSLIPIREHPPGGRTLNGLS